MVFFGCWALAGIVQVAGAAGETRRPRAGPLLALAKQAEALQVPGGAAARAPSRAGRLRASAKEAGPRPAGWFPGAFAPSYLDGSLPGDVGFDPLALAALARTGTASDRPGNPWGGVERRTQMLMMSPYERQRKINWMREAEIKHARLAMLAAVGWPLAEVVNPALSRLVGMPSAVEATGGRAPALLNGHLFDGVQGPFLALFLVLAAVLEAQNLDASEGLTPTGYEAGDLGFDPLKLRGKREDMPLAEIKHGRLAMLAVAGYVAQEALGTPVVR